MELQAPVVEADPARSRGGDEDTAQTTLLPCPNCDIQVVHKLAQLLLPGLAAACVDSTFRNPSSSLAVQLRAELVHYVTDRSNAPPELPAETGDDDPLPDHDDPGEALAAFLDDFPSSKRSMLASLAGRSIQQSIVVAISGWLPYLGGDDGRDDRIDDLVQEMETTRFWPIDRREAVARDLLRGLDADDRFRCRDELETEEGLAEHVAGWCRFRPVRCRNQVQGCTAEVSACRAEEHDDACAFKLLPCEQGCGLGVARRHMDRHCVTACPMKLANCPFYLLGCESAFPACNLGSHCAQFLRTHLRLLLDHKNQIVSDHHQDLEERLALLEKCDSHGTLLKALDVRALTNAVAELEKKMSAQDGDSYTGDDSNALT